jgi:hypothetical protein
VNEIKCPHCGKTFEINQESYAQILNQVRTHEFQIEIDKQIGLLKAQKDSAMALELQKADSNFQNQLLGKEQELSTLKAQTDQEIQKLSDQLNAQKELLDNQVKLAEEQTKNDYQGQLETKNLEVANLKYQIEQFDTKKELEITKAVSDVEKERDQLKLELIQKDQATQQLETSLKGKHQDEIKLLTEHIEQLKDLKTKMSTKMVGETLEQHCEFQFNERRADTYPKAYFEKDSDISGGTKGDYIFRDYDDDGTEIISIMFEMKNQMETTATKHKNQDFFAKLDKDRTEKNCEYAVLVSLLETDNELYNNGILDVSYKFPKMFVVRPQFFLPIIGLIRNAALDNQKDRAELALLKNQDTDINGFENEIAKWKETFDYNCDQSWKKFKAAIADIDKTITLLEKTKQDLQDSEKQLHKAYEKAEDLSIERLTKNNPTMKQKFDDLKKSEPESTKGPEPQLTQR